MNLFETADIIIYSKGKGVVLKEKSILAYDALSSRIIAFGEEALNMYENLQDNINNIKFISPLRRGMIADYTSAEKLFKYFLSKVWGQKPLFKVPVAVCVPKKITEIEKKALEDVLYYSGAKEVFVTDVSLEELLVEKPMLALPKNWKKFKIFISITKEEPRKYIAEQFLEVISFAKNEKISIAEVKDIFMDIIK